ncbi:MAG: tetratricopeptide repeat protein [Flavobacteriaceae bacterium]
MNQFLYILLFALFPLCTYGQDTAIKINNTRENDFRVKDFGLRLSESYSNGNASLFMTSIAIDRFFPKVILHDNANKKLTKFNSKFKTDFETKLTSFPNELIANLKNGDFYNFVSYHFDPIDKTYHIVFRYYSEEYGLDYHDYRILNSKDDLIIDDVFIYSSCQKLSETIKLLYLSELPKNYISSFTTKPEYKYILMLKNFVDAKNSNNLSKAYKHISLLNTSLKNKDRFTAMLKLELSRSLTEEAYFESMEEALQNFTLDPSINLSAIRYHYLNKDYEAVFKSINSIQNHTNDTFLDFEKGNLSYAAKNYESAEVFYKSMIENYPRFHLPKFSLLVIYEQEQAFNDAIQLLNVILNTSSYKKSTLIKKVKAQLPLLSNSSEFKTWQKK